MKCYDCIPNKKMLVVDSREKNNLRYRSYKCPGCHKIIWTTEVPCDSALIHDSMIDIWREQRIQKKKKILTNGVFHNE